MTHSSRSPHRLARLVASLAIVAPAAAVAAQPTATASPYQAPQLNPSWGAVPQLAALQDDVDATAPLASDADPDERTRDYDLEVGFRARRVSVPDSIMDIWYFSEDDPSWADTRPRPKLSGYALGLEFGIRGDNANGTFYVEYVKSLMKAGYWDDREEPPDPFDGDFLAPTPSLGLAAFGADYAYEAHFLKPADTNGAFGLSFLVGGGLGVSYLMGNLDRWGPADGSTSCPAGSPAFVCFEMGADSVGNKKLPKVFPMVDINAGLRFSFGERVNLRIEGGLHSLLYYGTALGVQF